MALGRVFSWNRYRRCGRVFRHPLRAHLQLARTRRGSGPHTLVFADGRTLRFERPRSFRTLWDAILTGEADLDPRCDETCLLLTCDGQVVGLRPDTSDAKCFEEVYLDDVYGFDAVAEPWDTVVDLGANSGLFAVRAAKRARRVIALEPVPDHHHAAELNFARADVAGNITLLNLAAWRRSDEQLQIHLSGNATSTCSVSPGFASAFGGAGGAVEVTTISLEDLFRRHEVERCSLLKCDIEGAEYDVFEAAPLEVLGRVDRILLEVHLHPVELPLERFHQLRDRLEQAGFALEHDPVHEAERTTVMLTATHRRVAHQAASAVAG